MTHNQLKTRHPFLVAGLVACSVILLGAIVARAENRSVDVTVTGDEGTAQIQHDIDIEKTDTGKSWTRESEGSDSRGGSWFSRTIGQAVRNSNGTGTWTSHTDGTRTPADGEPIEYDVDREGSWVNNGDGTIDRAATVNRSNDRGYEATIEKTGTTVKTEDGRSYTGTNTGSDSHGHTWSTDVQRDVSRNGDGTASIEETYTTTRDNGTTITRDVTGTATKTDTGVKVDKTATVTRTDADGNVIAKPDREALKAQWEAKRAELEAKKTELNSDEAGAARKAESQAKQAERNAEREAKKAEWQAKKAERKAKARDAKEEREEKAKRAREAREKSSKGRAAE